MRRALASERRNAGRWCLRAAAVLGGAVAGTALGWAISTASASATEVAPHMPANPETVVTDTVVDGAQTITTGASTVLGEASGHLAHVMPNEHHASEGKRGTEKAATDTGIEPSNAPSPASRQVANTVATRTANVVDDAALEPVRRTLGTVENLVRKPDEAKQAFVDAFTPPKSVQDFGKAVWQFFTQHPGAGLPDVSALPKLPALPNLPGVSAGNAQPMLPNAPPEADQQQQDSTQVLDVAKATSHLSTLDYRGVHKNNGDDGNAPVSPLRLPMPPLSTAPVAPGAGGTSGGHLDGSLLGVPGSAPVDFAAEHVQRPLPGGRFVPPAAGSQPGVTPD